MGFDGLSALATFNTPKLKKVNQRINNLGVFYAIAMNAELIEEISYIECGNEFITKEINRILRIKFELYCWL